MLGALRSSALLSVSTTCRFPPLRAAPLRAAPIRAVHTEKRLEELGSQLEADQSTGEYAADVAARLRTLSERGAGRTQHGRAAR